MYSAFRQQPAPASPTSPAKIGRLDGHQDLHLVICSITWHSRR
jgi:hypothetical protein